ncbi:MAG TPA: hypothetical protein PJ982_02260, partial [Lacipirellulaceae bacterium]|nr:hypothetical protein [Lacipirellulaceae bacterium]
LASSMPLGPDGFRGAVLLTAGHYDIATQLTIAASGVVLRGTGRDGDAAAVLHARGTSQRALVNIAGVGSQALTGPTRNMIDKTVPVGATSFRVDSTAGFAVGDTVRIERPSTAEWIHDIGMDAIPPRSDGQPIQQWQPGSHNLRYDRVITHIEGDRIFLDAPLANSFELQYGGGTIRRYTWAGRIENVGVENLRAESDFASATDDNHAWDFVSINAAQNVWVRQATSAYFARSAVLSNPGAKWVTVDNVVNLDPKSPIIGGRRYTFDLSGQLELVTQSEANFGRHDFVNNSTRPPGPHVFHRSVANNAVDESGPHQRWATGSLFDNVVVQGDQLNARNRGNFGTGHGWAGANMVIWNSTANSFIVQNPPTAQNWLIGSTGALINDLTFGPQPPGYVDSMNQRVGVDSLYESQLADAADIRQVHWDAAQGAWGDAANWRGGLAPGVYAIMHRDYLIGDIDGFVHDGPTSVDHPAIDPAWAAFVAASSGQPVIGFDNLAGGANVAFTIQHQLDPGQRVVHGALAMSLKQAGGSTGDDFVRLFNDDPENRWTYAALGWEGQINASTPYVGVLDLGGRLDHLQSGAVNVQVGNDTGVDWAMYMVSVATPIGDAAGAAVYVDNGGVARIDGDAGTVGALVLGSQNGGTLELAVDGRLAVVGPFLQQAEGILSMTLGAGGLSGVLDVGGLAMLDGTLALQLDLGYVPAPGDRFDLLAAGEVVGGFAEVLLPAAPADAAWDIVADATTLAVELFWSADFNRDGVVDGDDLAIWSAGFGAGGSALSLPGDATGDGAIDGADLLAWQRQLGRTSAQASSARVPEPATLPALLGTALAFRRKRQLRG